MLAGTVPYPNQDEERDGFRFRGGHAALDLTATLTGRLKDATQDHLARPGDVVRWLIAAGFECAPARADERTLDLARCLREAVYALAIARLEGGALPSRARKSLNAIAQLPAAAPEIDPEGRMRLRGRPDTLLAYLAREGAALLGGSAGARVRQCEADGCAILFLDTSRAGDRRWCSMNACGNRHKVAAYRRRKQT